MATAAISLTSPAAKFSPAQLAAFRRAHVARIKDAVARRFPTGCCDRTEIPSGMPHTLFAAGVFLTAAGLTLEPTPAEAAFGITPNAYAEMLRHDGSLRDAFMKSGYQALFGRWKPIVSPELAAELERAAAMSQAWDDMASAVGKIDGSFEAAKARFDALAGAR